MTGGSARRGRAAAAAAAEVRAGVAGRRGLSASCAAALFVLALLTGCGDSGSDGSAGAEGSESEAVAAAEPVGEPSAGSVVQYADCADWNRGSLAEKQATVIELREQLTPQTSETAESDLDDERALEILNGACKAGFSDSLRLYKLYVRAQAFAPLANEQDG